MTSTTLFSHLLNNAQQKRASLILTIEQEIAFLGRVLALEVPPEEKLDRLVSSQPKLAVLHTKLADVDEHIRTLTAFAASLEPAAAG